MNTEAPTPNPFEGLTIPVEKYPDALRTFWRALPDSTGTHWSMEFELDIDPLLERRRRLLEEARQLGERIHESCEALGGRMHQAASRHWSKKEIGEAFETIK